MLGSSRAMSEPPTRRAYLWKQSAADEGHKRAMLVKTVAYTQENIDKCWCGNCPVQIRSACAKDLYEASKQDDHLPAPERLGGLYCSTGRTICDDTVPTNLCNCAACLVWAENGLASNHYCVRGSAQETGV